MLDLGGFTGTAELSNRVVHVVGAEAESVAAFIDNITFHPVPESSSWLLLSLGIAGVVMVRRKLASRA